MTFSDLRVILLSDWDPLNIGDNPNLADEYDDYIPELLRLVNNRADFGMIERYLRKIESDLGVLSSFEKRVQTALQLAKRDFSD